MGMCIVLHRQICHFYRPAGESIPGRPRRPADPIVHIGGSQMGGQVDGPAGI